MTTLAQHFSLSAPLGAPLGVESQRLYWAMGALAVALVPHIAQLPPWTVLLTATAALWRLTIELRAWRLPPRWLRTVIAIAAMASVAIAFRTINGLDAGSALLALMAGMKLLETRGARDCTVLIFIGFVLLFAALLYNQSLVRLPYILLATWLLSGALLRIHHASSPLKWRPALRTAGTMLIQALPLAALLFVFFPRMQGQFWSLPARSATTGLDDEMTPGDISELTISGAPVFRVTFDGPLPPPNERYWRGPVLHEFDGRRWRREPTRAALGERVSVEGPAYRYRITLEPTHRNWLFALDVPTAWPEQALRLYDMQLITRRPITSLSSFELQSHTRFRSETTLSRSLRLMDTALPGAANPRSRALAQEMRAAAGSDAEFIQAILEKFRREEFYYTLSPPPLGDDSVDEFMFDTKRGFCEHFASAFTALVRAAGIPARVVTGYQGGEYNALGEYLLVRQSDAHAWSEVWLEDRGWVRVDPTAYVAPARVERNLDAAIPENEAVPGRFIRQNLLLARARQAWDAVNNFWNNQVVQYNELKQRSLMEWIGVKDADWRDLGIAFGLALALFFAALTAYLGWQYRPRVRDPVVVAYEQLCRKLARVGLARAPHEGPRDYLDRAAVARPELADALREARSLYVSLRYGEQPLPAELSRFKYLVNRLKL